MGFGALLMGIGEGGIQEISASFNEKKKQNKMAQSCPRNHYNTLLMQNFRNSELF
jgi:hypothetical protein